LAKEYWVTRSKLKTGFDFALALALTIPAIPVCMLCMIAIYLETHANPVFRQLRVGQSEQLFWIYKLRTMYPDTHDAASHQVSASQITKLGRVFRKYKIDELPQLINVMNGTMSFVGPRPCLPSQQELVFQRKMRGVQVLKPGITGPAQLAGIDMSTPVELAIADSIYLEPWSFQADIRYLWRTFAGGGRGDAVGSED
jgi:O-antigen biosynthesis protein WbqP